MNKNKKGGRNPIYDPRLKIAIAREYLTSNLSYQQLADKYDITEAGVNHIMRWYKKHYPDVPSKGDDDQQTEATNADLQKALKEANLKIMALEMLIETARTEEGIDLLKKPGTKQSKP
jgi:transposase-like protein